MASSNDVQTTLGRIFTDLQRSQAEAWILQAETIIGARAVREGTTLNALDQGILAMVVTEAVAARVKRPDDATQVQVQVDDAQTTRRYESATGQIEIIEVWWDMLFPAVAGDAFSVGFEA